LKLTKAKKIHFIILSEFLKTSSMTNDLDFVIDLPHLCKLTVPPHICGEHDKLFPKTDRWEAIILVVINKVTVEANADAK